MPITQPRPYSEVIPNGYAHLQHVAAQIKISKYRLGRAVAEGLVASKRIGIFVYVDSIGAEKWLNTIRVVPI